MLTNTFKIWRKKKVKDRKKKKKGIFDVSVTRIEYYVLEKHCFRSSKKEKEQCTLRRKPGSLVITQGRILML